VAPVGNGLQEAAEEVGGDALRGALMELGEGELRGPVDGYEEVDPALLGADLGDVEVEVAERVGLRLRTGLSPSVSGNREMPWRLRQRCSAERVRCGMVGCRA
jgi:hypothetical protein